jgi:hypothetical protein
MNVTAQYKNLCNSWEEDEHNLPVKIAERKGRTGEMFDYGTSQDIL